MSIVERAADLLEKHAESRPVPLDEAAEKYRKHDVAAVDLIEQSIVRENAKPSISKQDVLAAPVEFRDRPRGGYAEIRPPANASAEKKTNLTEASPSPPPPPAAAQADLTADNLPMIWKEALVSIEDMTADFASKCDSIAISGPNRVVVRFRKAYNKEQCQRPERKTRLEQALSQVAGVAVEVEFELLADLPGGAGAAKAVVSPVQSRDALAREARRHPLVKQAVELFDAVVDRVLERPRPAEAEDEETVVPEAAPVETS